VIRLIDLKKSFGGKEVLKGISMGFEKGRASVVLGRSGCGKSVMIKLILRLLPIDSGRIIINDIDTTEFSEDDMMGIRRKMGMLFQAGALFDSMNVFENVAYMLREHTRMKDEEIEERVKEKLSFVEMEGTEDLMPSELSGGMQKRIALARAMANNPEFIFFDEPTTGLDPITAHTINDLIKRVRDHTSATIIVVTHDLESAAHFAQKVVLIHDGTIHFQGSYDDFIRNDDRFVVLFRSGGKAGVKDEA
jgi:phospholipid/cholesterol/gamma-HCH transport system ATP-binding protein